MCFLKLLVILEKLWKFVTFREYKSFLELKEVIKLVDAILHAFLHLVDSLINVYVVMELIKSTKVSILIHMLMIAIQAHR